MVERVAQSVTHYVLKFGGPEKSKIAVCLQPFSSILFQLFYCFPLFALFMLQKIRNPYELRFKPDQWMNSFADVLIFYKDEPDFVAAVAKGPLSFASCFVTNY